jgi:hypothetical protein
VCGQEIEERLVIEMDENPADVENHVANQATASYTLIVRVARAGIVP